MSRQCHGQRFQSRWKFLQIHFPNKNCQLFVWQFAFQGQLPHCRFSLLLLQSSVEILEDCGQPITLVGNSAQIGQRPLRAAGQAFLARQQIAEVDEESAKALALVAGQSDDAGQVELLAAVLLLESKQLL